MPPSLSGNSVGFGPQGFGPSTQHFSQHPPAFGPSLPPPLPAAAAAISAPQFDYSHGQFSAFSTQLFSVVNYFVNALMKEWNIR